MDTTDGESKVRACADEYARQHAKQIAMDFLSAFSPEADPVSTFMAGSPGAGKTETSKTLLRNAGNIARIGADELREHFRGCGYNGTNSHLFQKSATKLVHEIHSRALKKRISFLLDGTFSNEDRARQNIERSLKRERAVFIIFVYQSPLIAWDFVVRREEVEGRRIRAEDFTQQFCASHAVANKMKQEFGNRVRLSLVIKGLNNEGVRFYQKSIQRVDDHIGKRYSEAEIRELIENYPAPAGA